jgi:hypothetical protein
MGVAAATGLSPRINMRLPVARIFPGLWVLQGRSGPASSKKREGERGLCGMGLGRTVGRYDSKRRSISIRWGGVVAI